MPKLYLLRHAQAGSAFSGDDKDRPLTPHGIEQATSLAPHIKDISKTLCSNARRTQMTLQALIDAGVNAGDIAYEDALYNAPTGDILMAIQSCGSENLLVVAHNPGIHMLARSLANEGNQNQMEQLSIFYNPASLSIFDCDIESWSDLKPLENKLLDLITPV